MPDTNQGPYDDAPVPSQDGANESGQQESGKTAMLNKGVLGGKDIKPGETISLKVIAIHGDEVEVSCDGGESEQSQEEDQQEQPPQEQGSGMRSMLED